MSSRVEQISLARLVSLRERALEQALKALAAAREHALEMRRILDEQLALIDTMRRELRALDAQRSHAQGRTAEALKLAAMHRRWLVFDLEKEEFYLATMESDVELADEAVAERQSDWRRLRARLDAFAVLGADQTRDQARRDERRTAAELDDRPSRTGLLRAGRAGNLRVGS